MEWLKEVLFRSQVLRKEQRSFQFESVRLYFAILLETKSTSETADASLSPVY